MSHHQHHSDGYEPPLCIQVSYVLCREDGITQPYTVDREMFTSKIFLHMPQNTKFFYGIHSIENNYHSKYVTLVQVTMSCFSSAVVMALHSTGATANGLPDTKRALHVVVHSAPNPSRPFTDTVFFISLWVAFPPTLPGKEGRGLLGLALSYIQIRCCSQLNRLEAMLDEASWTLSCQCF